MRSARAIPGILPLAILYFFFNSFLLPHGLLYTTILTPVFLVALSGTVYQRYLICFIGLMALFAIVHFIQGVDMREYIESAVLLVTVAVFALRLHQYAGGTEDFPQVFRTLLFINLVGIALVLPALLIPVLKDRFWFTNAMTIGIESFSRLKMLSYEPSYYAGLFVPIVLYFLLKILLLGERNSIIIFFMMFLPLALSLSFGVLLCLGISLTILFGIDFKLFRIHQRFRFRVLASISVMLILLGAVWFFFPNNIIFLRLSNVLEGRDISFMGRSVDSFTLSHQIASEGSVWFGVGPGQVKAVGLPYFQQLYKDSSITQAMVGIPNVLGDTYATFGIAGLIFRFGLQIFLFFKMGVWKNYYCLALFIYAFIYQFTGSYIMNIMELTIWVFAYSPQTFKEFCRNRICQPAAKSKLATI